MSRREGKFFVLVLLLSALSLSCDSLHSSEDIKSGDTLVIPEYQKPGYISPLLTSSTLSARLSEIVFDGLVQLDEHFEVKPHLAQSWSRSDDGRSWTFQLKPGVKFHDGVELTAEDVAFTFQKIVESQVPLPFSSIFKEIESITVKDRHGLEIILKKPLASFLHVLDTGIVPKHLLEGKDLITGNFNRHPIGTGPFKLAYWSEKEFLLSANEEYFLGKPSIDRIRVIVFPNREAAWAKLMAGEADFFFFITPEHYQIMNQVPTFSVYSVPRPYYYLVVFNLKNEILNDRRIRQALNYAVNKQEIIQKVLKGQGQVAAGTIYPGSWAFNPDLRPYPYDPKKALSLLKEAGWEDHDGDHVLDKNGRPFEFTVHVNAGDDVKQKALLLIQQNLMDIGIRMKIKVFDASDLKFLFNKQFQAHFPEIVARGDPDLSYRHWHSSQIEQGYNVSSYRNREVDRLLEAGRTEFDPEKRKAIYFQYQDELLKDPPGIFLFWTNYLVGVHERFKNVQISPVSPFANIREWYVPKAQQKYATSKTNP